MLTVIHVAGLTGALMFISSIFFRRPDAPRIPSWNYKHWTPIWRQESHFRPPGFLLMYFGFQLFSFALVADLTLRFCK